MSTQTPMQDNDDGRIFYDIDGNACTLYQLVRRAPEWAESRIRYYLSVHDDLLEALKSIENDSGHIPDTIWEMRNKAIRKASQ